MNLHGFFGHVCAPSVEIERRCPIWAPSKSSANVGRIARRLVAIGCDVDVVGGYYAVLYEDAQKRARR